MSAAPEQGPAVVAVPAANTVRTLDVPVSAVSSDSEGTATGHTVAVPVPAVATRGAARSVGSAAALLMASAVLSGLLGLLRIKYVNFLFGAGVQQDAYRAAFKLPDLVSYFLVGSAASVTLITMMNRLRGLPAEAGGGDAAADRALSVVLTTMLAVLGVAVVLAMLLAPAYVGLNYPEFLHDARGALCISMTRWLLPAQLFFFVGSMMSARLQVRKIFLYQAATPVIYNAGIVLGAWLLHARLGIYSLIVGVYGGVLVGSALVNTVGALRTGLRFRPVLGFGDPLFREWLRSALPLMLGVSLVMFDGIFFNRFASDQIGGLTLINNAKDLFNAPFNVIGPAAGAASLPFFAALFQARREYDFSFSVGSSVSRLLCFGLLVSAWMIALAPWLMDLLRGGRLHHADVATTTALFTIFALSLPLWAVQGIYARGFYAAGDTRTPAIAGTLIVLASYPLYGLMYRWLGLRGLAWASDLGITAQTAVLAVLLHKRRLVSLVHVDVREVGRAVVAAVAAFVAVAVAAHFLPAATSHAHDLITVAVGSVLWAAVGFAVLRATGSRLPTQILRRGRRA